MKQTILCILACFSCAAAWAMPGQQTPSYAARLLDQAIARLESMSDYRADFTLSYGEVPAARGTMYAAGDKYRVEMADFTLLCDGRFTYTVMYDEQEVTVRSVSDSEAVMMGSVQQILRRFAAQFVPRTDRREGTVQYLRLVPRDPDNPSQYLSVGIDTATGLPVRMEEVSRDGSRTVLDVISLERGGGASPALYEFREEDHRQKGYYIARP